MLAFSVITLTEHQFARSPKGEEKCQKWAFVQNLVKPPKPANSRQAPDSAAEINLKIWRVYPSEFAMLVLEIKLAQAFAACAFSFAQQSSSPPAFFQDQCKKPRPLHQDAVQRPGEALPRGQPRPAASASLAAETSEK
jgi:hypothetical protein